MEAPEHQPVLLREAIEALALREDGIYIDGTFGRGGHTRALLARLGPRARVLSMDRDPEAIEAAMRLVADDARLTVVQGRFGQLRDAAAGAGITQADGVLLDLGVSSPQLAHPGRGFSFSIDGPLDMRMDPDAGEPAGVWLARAGEREIADTLFQLGEERHSRRIARHIVAERAREPITTTAALARLVTRALPRGPRTGLHPATRTFQALRMRVNDELGELARVLPQAVELLRPGGRLAVISFHSLEDRMVKRFLRAQAQPPSEPGAPAPRLRLVGRLVRPQEDEVAGNPRARSARMRVAERLQ